MKKIICYFDPNAKDIYVKKTTDTGETKLTVSSPYNFVSNSEIVAKVVDVNSEEEIPSKIDPDYSKFYKVIDFQSIKVGEGIFFNEAKNVYQAKGYGFVIFVNSNLRILSTGSISNDKVNAYYTICPTKLGKIPTYDEIEHFLKMNNIAFTVDKNKINAQLNKIDITKLSLYKIPIAKGKAPAVGHREYFIPLIEIEKKAGEILKNGSIDYKEVVSIIKIEKGNEILQRIPEVKSENGFDIYGKEIINETDNSFIKGYICGENLVQSDHDENIFVSSIDGCIDVNNRIISVLPIVVIDGDVDYKVGNIDFNGSVHVKGLVLPGFSIVATGDITVEKSVEDSKIIADGDIIINGGVVGKEAVQIKAGGTITVKYFLNAKAEAAGEIIVEDSILNSQIFSNEKISVVSKHGKIVGGEIRALYDIVAKVCGSKNGVETHFYIGKNLALQEEELEAKEEMNKWKTSVVKIMEKIKVNFGEEAIADSKAYFPTLSPEKGKSFLLSLKELNESNKNLKVATGRVKEIESQLVLKKKPEVIVTDRIYPGVVLHIKDVVKPITEEFRNVKYCLDPDEDNIISSPAV